MKVRMINALDGRGKQLGLLNREQAGELLSELSLRLTDVQDRIERAASGGEIGQMTYDPLRAEAAQLRESLVALRTQLDAATTPEALQVWQERALSMRTSLSLFQSRLALLMRTEPVRRGRMFVVLAVGSVVLLGGTAAILVARSLRGRKRGKRRR